MSEQGKKKWGIPRPIGISAAAIVGSYAGYEGGKGAAKIISDNLGLSKETSKDLEIGLEIGCFILANVAAISLAKDNPNKSFLVAMGVLAAMGSVEMMKPGEPEHDHTSDKEYNGHEENPTEISTNFNDDAHSEGAADSDSLDNNAGFEEDHGQNTWEEPGDQDFDENPVNDDTYDLPHDQENYFTDNHSSLEDPYDSYHSPAQDYSSHDDLSDFGSEDNLADFEI